MASLKVEIGLKKKKPPEHKYSVTFVTKVGTITNKLPSTNLKIFLRRIKSPLTR